ncbi:MAG: hypothetical protein HC863_02970, partial [Myxococcales bacterium]|nr:hypothetical protein [Myxococcales bacterium]
MPPMPPTPSSSEPASTTALPRLLVRVQRGLEELYRIATGVTVEDFVVDAASR